MKNTKIRTRILSILAIVFCLVMALGITAFAAENEPDEVTASGTWGGIDWSLTSDGTLTIAPTKGTPTQIANRPKQFTVGQWPEAVRYNSKGDGAAIEGWPYNRAAVKKLVIEEGVTSIGSFAAQSFTNLTGEVVIPSTVTYIGQEAFQKSTMTKLTFAAGGTEELCIAQGAFKNLIIEEVALPSDRPVHLHAWVFNNCLNLKNVTLPDTLVSVHGTNHIDYFKDFNAHSNPTWTKSSEMFAYNSNMETITFGNQEVMDMFYANNNGTSKDYTKANVGLVTYCDLQDAIDAAEESGETVTLLKDIPKNTELVIEKPITMNLNSKTANGTFVLAPGGSIEGEDIEELTVVDQEGNTVENNNGAFVPSYVTKIGTQGYATLADAIKNATAGATITFVADVNENVTVNKAVTIDGAKFTYTGMMTLKADTTIKNVNFDGKGYNGYAVETRGASYLTIEGCTVKNYMGFVQLASATALTTVKNVTASNMNYGVKVDYSGAVVLENVDITAGVAAVLNSNYGEKTITINGSKLNILGTWTRNNTIKTNYVFEGANTIDTFIIDAAIDNFKLAASATLTAPNEVTVTTVEDYEVKYENGAYVSVEKPNAIVMIGETGYATLAEALAAATAGQTITFVADITEDVTVNKAVTIDGAGKTYTGKMTLKADTTIKNVNFDGKGYNGYAVETRGANYVTIEDCTAKNYMGFVQLASGTALTTVKNVTVSNVNYGVKVDYSNAVVLDNADITAGVAAVLNSNYGGKTITIKNSKLNILGTWTRNNTTKTNYVFDGENVIDTFIIDAAIDNFKLEVGATLTAPNVITATATDASSFVKYEDGKYYVHTGLAGTGTKDDPYQIGSVEDLVMFRDSVNAGEDKYNALGMYFVLTDDIDLAGINWVGIGSINAAHGFMGNFDGKEYTIKNLTINNPTLDSDGYAYAGFFSVTEGTDKNNQNVIKNLTIENVTINTNGHIVAAAIAYPYYTIVEDVTVCGNIAITGGDYTAGVLAYTRRCVNASDLTLSANDGSYITGNQTVGGVISDIQMNGGLTAVYSNFSASGVTVTGTKSVGGIAGIIATQTLNGATVKNVNLVCSDARVGIVAGSLGGTSTVSNVTVENVSGATAIIGATYNGAVVEAVVGNTYYDTFAKAYAAANEGETITLLAPIVVAKGETLTLDKNVTITYTSSVVGEDMFTVHGTLNISAGTITYVNTDKTGNNVTVSTISAEPGSVVNVTGGIVENKTVYSTGSYAYAIDLLTNGNLGDVTVTISGGKVYSDYMAIRQFNNGTACKNTLTVTGGEIYGAKRAIQIHNKNDAAYLTITDGKIEAGEGGYALCLFPENATNVAVTGGNFVGEIYSGTNAFVSGGTFTNMYAEYVAEGYVLNENKDGSYGVVKTTVTIDSVEDLLAFAAAVTGNKEYQGVKVAANAKAVVLLNADLDLTNSGFAPIGNGGANAFSGTFDGQGYTISNMTLSCDYYRGVGFFRSLGNGAVVKNVTFVNANVNNGAGTGANHFYGVVAGFSTNLTLDNVNVKDSTVTCKYSGAVMVGCLQSATTIKNSTVDNVTLKTNDIRAAVYGIIGNSATGHTITVENNTVENTKLDIKGEIKKLPETVGYGSWSAGNDYAETTYVAQIGDKKYSTLIDAIKAATAGDTITIIGNVELAASITIDKNLTINGNGNTITGTMNVNDNLTVTVQNVNFVNGGIAKATKSAKGNYTIKGCTFSGAGEYAYALSFKGANKVTVEDCTVSNYKFGFLYVSSGAVNVSVKNVTVDKCPSYAVYFGSGVNTATFENFTVKNSNNGFVINNTTNRYFTIKNCTMENVGTAINYSKGTNTITCTVLGVNDLGGAALSDYVNVVGVQIGNVYYGTLAEAWAAAQDGDTIKLLGNIAIDTETFTVADGKKITLDMNGKKITVTDNATKNYELFYIYGEMIVTGNGTIELTANNNRAWGAMSAIFHNRGGNLTIENGTFKNLGGTDMAYVVDNSGNWYGDATTVINDGTLTSTYTAIRNRMEQNTHGASGKAILVINGGTIDGTTSAIWAQAASTSTKAPATGSITVNGGKIGTINTARSNGAVSMTTINGGTVASFKGETGELTVNGGKITGTITICHDNGDTAKYKVVKNGVYYAAVAKIGVTYYATLQDAVDACSAGGKVTLVDNAKGAGVVINKSLTINFAGYTYTLTEGVGSTGTESNGFQILVGNNVTLSAGTIKVAEEAADKFYILIQNYADLSLFNMNLDGTYLDKWSKTDGDSYVVSNNSGYISMTGKTNITTNNDGDKAVAFDACDSKYYADKPVVFVASTVKIDGKAVADSYDKIEVAARIGSTQFFAALKDAFAYASSGNTIKLMADVAVSEGITNTKKVTLDLGGKTITGTDNATGSFAIITNKGELTITGNGTITLKATNNRGWNAYSSVISNTVGGKLIVKSGTIEHLGGTDMAYAIDNLTNGKGTYAETVINGGIIKSTYRAIRMFLNGTEAQNILTVDGGVIEGANKSIWMQDPSANANTGSLTVTKDATLNGDVYLTVTAGSTEWPVEVSIAASAVNGEVLTSNVPAGYKLVNNDVVYTIEKVVVKPTYVAKVGVTKYTTLQAAIDACPDYGKVTLLGNVKGPGVVIDKNITILFNGYTYTITEPVGSKGTETLGFQILKGNTVTLNSGKIEIAEEAADKFAILIQNYANLTVYNMILDGTNLGRDENYSYVLSVNSGNVKVNGNSVLTAKAGEGNYALDVYDYSSAGYSLPTVTVTSVVKINGKISAGAKYGTVYYATVAQAKAATGKNVAAYKED